MKNNKLPLGLACLFLFIPAPTLIFNSFKHLAEKGYIRVLDSNVSGISADVLLMAMIAVSLSLFIFSLRELGNCFIQQNISDY
jgi:hypothetical protein